MEQQLKQQLMQKKNLCKSLAKKESTVFSILPFAKIVPTIKKHHPPSYQKVAYTFQNDIQSSKNCTKAFMKKEKCMRKSTKKNIDEIPPIHINFYLKSSSLICQSYISISLLFWAPMCVLACLKLSFHKTKMIPPQFFYPPDLWKN